MGSAAFSVIQYCIFIIISLVFMGFFGDLLYYSSLVVCEEIASSNKRVLFSSTIKLDVGSHIPLFSCIYKIGDMIFILK